MLSAFILTTMKREDDDDSSTRVSRVSNNMRYNFRSNLLDKLVGEL